MPKVFGFAGFSGVGKTTLIEKLLPILIGKGIRVSVIKHAHHDFDIDIPGKDSYRHRAAGAHEVLITANKRWVLMHELRNEVEPTLEEQLGRLSPCDLVIVEGFKRVEFPKIEIWREANGKPMLYPQDPNIVAVACDAEIDCKGLPLLPLNHPVTIAEFIVKRFLND
ncbi:molybdopterin-guanine dinucleotide biosynthesis protein B [Limnobacter sp. YS8-69]|uniref:Molybdopterin-guanine dinucleotide biosynthesis protein B n=1 Tax=Limnobacter parvus TaxID=2939690 RepID=A0ABT1XHF6_9BURK|nr:molybdopterin-guanine dinucleotide biosynthesis protein B [Limnobacter parvus]